MDWSTLGDWGLVALGIAALGLPVQIALGFALGTGRRVPVSVALVLPVVVLILGLAGVNHGYSEVQKSMYDPSDPAWAPWYALYDRAAAASPAPLTGMLGFVLTMPALMGAAVASLRHERRGNIGPLVAATGGLLAGVGIVVAGFHLGRAALALPGLLLALVALLSAACLAAVRPRTLALSGIGVAGLVVATLGLVVTTLGSLETDVTDLLDDLTAAAARMDELAVHEHLAQSAAFVLLGLPLLSVATTLPGLGFIRARDAGPRQGLDIAATGALLGSAILALAWVLVRRSLVGRLVGAHAAWVLAAAPGYDVPHHDVLPPRVLVPGEVRSMWVELHDGGGATRTPAMGSLDVVGRSLGRGDGVVLPWKWLAEDLYYLLVEAPAGEIELVGCAPVAPPVAAQILGEPLLALGRCGAFPLRTRVAGAMPDPRELILVPGPHVQDGLDVVDLTDLTDLAGRDVVLRLQVDCTIPELVTALGTLREAAHVYLGWGVTTEGDDLTIGVEPGLRVRQPEAAEGAVPVAVPDAAAVLAAPG